MVISDRISAFDCIWHGEGGWHGVPGKGAAPGDAVSDAPLCGRCHVAAVTVATLKAHRADVVNTPDAQGGTPLHYASAIGDVRACKSLLRHGADRCGVVLPPWERVVAWFA